MNSTGLDLPTRASRRRPWRTALIAMASTALMFGLAIPSAFAASGPYTIDGSVPDAGAALLEDDFGSVKELGPLNSSTTKIGVIHKDGLPTLGMTNPNAQVDLAAAWVKLTRHTDGKDWLYFAWQRDSNSGSGFIAYEFMANPPPAACAYATASDAALIADCNPWAHRAAGDFLILWDQQGGSRELIVRQWTGTAPNLTLTPLALSPTLYEAQYSADGFKGEAAVNLTDAVPGSSTACRSIANTIPSTVTGNSDTADYKDTILTRTTLSTCTGDVVTTPQTAAGTAIDSNGVSITTDGVVAVRDQAVISVTGGNPTPAGSVSFWLCKLDTGTCDSGGTGIGGAVDLTGTTYPATVNSPTAYVTSAGRYCWRATWTGDAANDLLPDTDSSAGECFTVTPVTPTLSTRASATVTLGNAVSDTATLGGTAPQPTADIIHTATTAGAAAGGTITFRLYGPKPQAGGCGPLVYTSPSPFVPVSGDNTYSSGTFTPTVAGTYSWVAQYSGNLPNTTGVTHNSGCTVALEDVAVTSVPSSLTSAQSFIPNDSVTVSASAGGPMAGTVSFAAYESTDCTGTAIYSTTASVSGASPVTVSTGNTTVSTTAANISWKVSFDSTNPAQRDIGDTCHEKTTLSITNGGTISSTP